jgi:hypothetical protein
MKTTSKLRIKVPTKAQRARDEKRMAKLEAMVKQLTKDSKALLHKAQTRRTK